MKKCLVTLTIGDEFKSLWEKYFKRTWDEYAARHGYDIVAIDDYIDTSPKGTSRAPHWQKCLVLEHEEVRKYDHAVWVDADILINYHTAPCIVGPGNSDGIGCVSFAAQYPNREKIDNVRKRELAASPAGWTADAQDLSYAQLYEKAGLPGDIDDMVNTGVLVMKPPQHAAFMRRVYDEGIENKYSGKENIPLSYHLFKEGMVRPIDTRFNKLWDDSFFESYPFLQVVNFRDDRRLSALCVTTAYHNAYFLHFLGGNTRNFVGLVMTEHYWEEAWRNIFTFFEAQKEG